MFLGLIYDTDDKAIPFNIKHFNFVLYRMGQLNIFVGLRILHLLSYPGLKPLCANFLFLRHKYKTCSVKLF